MLNRASLLLRHWRFRAVAAGLAVAVMTPFGNQVAALDAGVLAPPGVAASNVDDVAQARQRVDSEVASLLSERSRVTAAEALVTRLTGDLQELEGNAVATRDRLDGVLAELDSASSELSDVAVQAYLHHDELGLEFHVGQGVDRLQEYLTGEVLVAAVADKWLDEVGRLTSEEGEIRNDLRDLEGHQNATSGRIADARAELDRARTAVSAAEAKVEKARNELTAAVAASVPAEGASAVAGIGSVALDAYMRGAERLATERPECRIQWWALAGIGRVESGHGTGYGGVVGADGVVSPPVLGPRLDGGKFSAIRDTDDGRLDGDTEWDRAVGPMQFIPSTWVGYVGDGVSDPHNIYDAALAAGRYLCTGARGLPLDTLAGLRAAAFSYNHSQAYVDKVVDGAQRYAALGLGPAGPRIVSAGLPASGEWSVLGGQAQLDLVAGRPIGDAAGGLVALGAALPQRSTVVLVAGPLDSSESTSSAALRVADGLMGRRIVVVVTSADPATATAVSAAVETRRAVSVIASPGSGTAWPTSELAGSTDGLATLIGAAASSF